MGHFASGIVSFALVLAFLGGIIWLFVSPAQGITVICGSCLAGLTLVVVSSVFAGSRFSDHQRRKRREKVVITADRD